MAVYHDILHLLLGERDIAIWGTGNAAGIFCTTNQLLLDGTSYFIDNDIAKQGQEYLNKQVRHPSGMDFIEAPFIIVTGNSYSDISKQLISYGLEEGCDFVSAAAIKEFLNSRVIQLEEENQTLLETKLLEYNNTKLEQIEKLIEQKGIKVVSFDIFDTLLKRTVEKPTDLFELLGKQVGFQGNFKEMRIMAEKTARSNRPKEQDDICLNDIYKTFSDLYNISTQEKEYLMQKEMEVEFNNLKQKDSGFRLYKRAVEYGKEVIITSDMYLSSCFLTEVLNHNGYHLFAKLYVSSEEKVAKGSGRLFEYIVDTYQKRGIKPDEILHIGDNLHADIKMAYKWGMKTGVIPKHLSVLSDIVY